MKPTKRVINAAARLAVFAMASHEALVRSGDHTSQTPPQINEMAEALGMEALELMGIGWDLIRADRKAVR